MLKRLVLCIFLLSLFSECFCWGFYGHRKINYLSVFLLPPEMMVLYKPNITWLEEHSIDPDKRRYAVQNEAPRHFLDIDRYGKYPYPDLPRNWNEAVAKYSEDTLMAHGIVPWHVQTMLHRLTQAFKEKNFAMIMKNSAEIGHYIADAHVPLHASSNHNGQHTGQRGIHGFWESRVPELLDKDFDFFIGKAVYIKDPGEFIWDRVLESALQADTVLLYERQLTAEFPADQKYAFEQRGNSTIRQYSTAFTVAYNKKLNGMVERRMRQSISTIASFWYTAWVNAGQPNLKSLVNQKFTEADQKEFDKLNESWKAAPAVKGREHDD